MEVTAKHPRIAVITTTRAEWNLLQPVVAALVQNDELETVVLAGGSHLLAEHGLTVTGVERSSGCPVIRVDYFGSMRDTTASHHAMARLTGQAVVAFADALADASADVTVVLGDRYEIMGAAIAAASLGLPLVHIEGGHVTEGAIDERYRHAISKLADLHFVALPVHARRVAALGEMPDSIICTGAIGVAQAKQATPLSAAEMLTLTGFDHTKRPVFIATIHPETASGLAPEILATTFVNGLAATWVHANVKPAFVLTASNLDPGGDAINSVLRDFAQHHPNDVRMFDTIGKDYLRAVAASAGVVGNSSSGILESSAIGVPTLNIGTRQKGRDRYGPVVECNWSEAEISAAITAMGKSWNTADEVRQSPPEDLPWNIIARHIAAMNTQKYQGKSFVDLPAQQGS